MSVARISLVSPERSKQIEGILFRMAQTGQLRGKVTESQLIDLLEQVRLPRFLSHKGSLSLRLRRLTTSPTPRGLLWSVPSWGIPRHPSLTFALQFQRRKDLDDDLDLDL